MSIYITFPFRGRSVGHGKVSHWRLEAKSTVIPLNRHHVGAMATFAQICHAELMGSTGHSLRIAQWLAAGVG
jgi:hypothetical protein